MTNESGSGPSVSWFAKLAFSMQAFLLKRGWMGPVGSFLMAITTTGRKSGKRFTVPIGYLNDGDAVIAMNPTGNSNWMKNVQASGEAILHIKGQSMSMQGKLVSDPGEKRRIFDIYKQSADTFPRYFGVTVDAPEGALNAALDKAHFVRFERLEE